MNIKSFLVISGVALFMVLGLQAGSAQGGYLIPDGAL